MRFKGVWDCTPHAVACLPSLVGGPSKAHGATITCNSTTKVSLSTKTYVSVRKKLQTYMTRHDLVPNFPLLLLLFVHCSTFVQQLEYASCFTLCFVDYTDPHIHCCILHPVSCISVELRYVLIIGASKLPGPLQQAKSNWRWPGIIPVSSNCKVDSEMERSSQVH